MKTAEEWIKIIQCQSGYMGSNALAYEDDILSIQLDAWKQGMSDAVEAINKCHFTDDPSLMIKRKMNARNSI